MRCSKYINHMRGILCMVTRARSYVLFSASTACAVRLCPRTASFRSSRYACHNCTAMKTNRVTVQRKEGQTRKNGPIATQIAERGRNMPLRKSLLQQVVMTKHWLERATGDQWHKLSRVYTSSLHKH